MLDALLYSEWQIEVGKGQASEVTPADGGVIYAGLCSLCKEFQIFFDLTSGAFKAVDGASAANIGDPLIFNVLRCSRTLQQRCKRHGMIQYGTASMNRGIDQLLY